MRKRWTTSWAYQPNATYFLTRIMDAWVYLVAALAKVQEGSRTLLDNTLVLAHSETEFAKFHTIDNIPMMTAGSAGWPAQDRHLCRWRGHPGQPGGADPATGYGRATGSLGHKEHGNRASRSVRSWHEAENRPDHAGRAGCRYWWRDRCRCGHGQARAAPPAAHPAHQRKSRGAKSQLAPPCRCWPRCSISPIPSAWSRFTAMAWA